MINVVLFEPEIPSNTGAIIRLCANTGCCLHLIHPLGFGWDDKKLRRAGLDYHEFADIRHYHDFQQFQALNPSSSVYAFTTKTNNNSFDFNYSGTPYLLFGSETKGLGAAILNQISSNQHCRIPMQPHSRSMNLANSVSVAVYEAWRQQQFCL